jgi:hypothetical protein
MIYEFMKDKGTNCCDKLIPVYIRHVMLERI